MKARNGAVLVVLAMAVGCSAGETADQPAQETQAAAAPATTMATAALQEPTGPIDQALAKEGEGYFTSRGCASCHKIDAKLIGPALKGITTTRSYDWIVAMVVRPDSMQQYDAEAKKLLAEYGTPMVNMGATKAEARALYEYLRQKSQ
jgi:cytochrome c2